MRAPLDLAALEAYAASCGVTRVADLSRLDDLGIHVVAATRTPRYRASISVTSGRGASLAAARLAALAEAIERVCAEPDGHVATIECRPDELDAEHVGLAELGTAELEGGREAWCRGARLESRTPVWVPAAAVFFPYLAERLPFRPATHGLAADVIPADATTRGLLECIERDAYTHAVARLSVDRPPDAPPVDLSGLPAPAAAWVARVTDRGRLLVRHLRSETGVPVALCTIELPDARGNLWWHGGCAAAFDLAGAVERAIGEALQSRLVEIQGSREDLSPTREPAHPWFIEADGERATGLSEAPSGPATLAALTRAVVAIGLPEPVVIDLSRADAPLRVVRVVAPGLEVWAHDPSRLGARCRRWLAP